jgi:membrane protease YdiL (CAAX protease family)
MKSSERHLAAALLLPAVLTLLTFGVMGLLGRRFLSSPEAFFAAPPVSFLLLGVAAALRAGGVVGLGLVKIGGLTLGELGWRRQSPATAIALGVAGAALMIGALVALLFAFGVFDAGGAVHTIATFTPGQRALFACFALESGFTEETLFRGYVQPVLVSRLGLPVGIVAQAALFSLYHVPRAPLPLLTRLSFGLVLGVLRGRERPLWACAIAHGLLWILLGSL